MIEQNDSHPFLFYIEDFFEDKNLGASVRKNESRAHDIIACLTEALERLSKADDIYALLN